MRAHLTTLCLLLASAIMLIAGEGPLVFREDFDSPEPLAAWTSNGPGQVEVTDTDGNHSLRVHLDQRGNHLVWRTLPIERVRGSRLTLSARVRAEDVVKAPEPWHGVKVMWQVTSPRGVDYQNVPNLAGTFANKEVSVNVEVPSDATEVRVLLGLGEASGTAWFDDVEGTVSAKPRVRPSPQPALLPPEKLDRRIDVPRLRGVMYGPQGKEEDLRTLAAWGGNHIRWQFYWYDGTFPERRLDFALYDRWLEETIAAVDRALPLCRELGIRLVIDLHTPPGAMDGAQMAIFRDAACQQKFIETWDKLARHYRDEPAVWAYDLLNEPAEGKAAPGLMDWRTLAEHVARRIRAIDEKHGIIVEPGPHGGWANLAYFEPLPLPGIIYSAHVYDPLLYTHQGVLDFAPRGPVYPGMVDGVYWDKAKLREILAPIRAYQQDYNVPIYIGEFSAARWATGASRYLADCIEIFEEYGWDWAYHAFREWHGWNLEIANTPPNQSAPKAATPTDRLRVIQDALKPNKPNDASQ